MNGKSAKKQRCYLYLRVSTEMQVEGYSLDAQRERLVREANHRDMQVVEEFRDEGKSGKNVSGRPAFQEMLRRIQDRTDNVDYVLVFKLSRFGRNTADVLNNLQIMQDYGVNLLSVEEGIDSAGAAGKLMISVIAAVAEIERENIQAQTMAGRMQKAREGRWNGGQAPYGYTIDKERGILVVDEEEAEIVRLIYDRYLNYEQGANGVAKWMNNTGYRKNTRQNGKYVLFSAHFIKGVLDNPVYCGKIAYGRRRNEKIDGTRNEFHVVKQPAYETFCGKHEAIIDQDTWDAVQRKRSATSIKHEKTYSLEHEHILSGILKCPVCGAPMYGSVNRKRKKDGTHYKDIFYYVCKHRKMVDGQSCTYGRQVHQDIVDKEVEAIMSEAMQSSIFADELREIMNDKTDDNRLQEQLEALQRSRIQYVGAKDKLAVQIDLLDVTDRAYDAKYADMQKRLDKLYDEIMTVDSQIAQVKQDMARQLEARATIDNAYGMLSFFGETFPCITDAEKKEIINAWVDCVEIYPECQDDGRWVRAVRFKFPVMLDGEVCTEWLHKRSYDETVVLLSKGEIDSRKVRVEFSLEDMDMSGFQKGATYGEIKAYVLEKFGLKVSSLYISQVKRKCGLEVGENYNLAKSENAKVPTCPPEKEKAINYRFTISQQAQENMKAAVADGNNIVEFMQSTGYISFAADASASSRDLYAAYKLWCEDNAYKALSMKSFCNYLNQSAGSYGISHTNNIYIGSGRRSRGFNINPLPHPAPGLGA